MRGVHGSVACVACEQKRQRGAPLARLACSTRRPPRAPTPTGYPLPPFHLIHTHAWHQVVTTCSEVFPLLAATLLGDGVNATLSGLLRGAGRQELGALLSLGSYW